MLGTYKMTKLDLISFTVGVFAVWLILLHPVLGFVFALGFMFYKRKETLGFIIGLGAGAVGLYILGV